ncbi:MAG TPA: hypothetical protein VEA40_16800 [Ramlibacter sp.]|nr:hypothetical protein [Ramlibacter sp.]
MQAGLVDIRGPLQGYYLACYTVGRDDQHWGYAKLCATRPESAFETPSAMLKVCGGLAATAEAALEAAISAGIRRLPRRPREWTDTVTLHPGPRKSPA